MSLGASGPLVQPEQLESHLETIRSDDPQYRLLEVSIREDAYRSGHIPGALDIDWRADLQDTETFDVLDPEAMASLLGNCGITPETTVVLYGDFFNWFAAHTYWLLRYFDHDDVVLLDGGRKHWMRNGYPTTTERPAVSEREYPVPSRNESIRVRRDEVENAVEDSTCLLDVRAPSEYRGDILAPPGWNEGVQRGGHIPGAINKPCRDIIKSDHRFRSREELAAIFSDIPETDPIIVYCRVGERSALVWFALVELLGYHNVSYYYGSFVEWANSVGLPVERASSADLR